MTARLRVCELITELSPAGAERCVVNLATGLPADRFEVQVAALEGGALVETLRAAAVKVTLAGAPRRRPVRALMRLARLLRRERIDLLHTHLFHADLAGRAAAALAGTARLLHTVHVAERRFRPHHFAFARLLAGRCDRIVCVSESVKRHHARLSGLGDSRYAVIPNGIDVDRYRRDELARQRLRRQWGVADGETLVAFLGRLDPQKDPLGLLAAFERAVTPRPQPAMKLVMAGTGSLEAAVRRAAERPSLGGCVKVLGFRDDVPAILSAADLLAMPSRWEGFGLAAAEAMAASLPVAATRVEGLGEVVLDGQTGLLTPPGDTEAFAAALRTLAGDPALRERMGRRGLQRARRLYSLEGFLAAHASLYAEVANCPPARRSDARR
jgi:glycosyltransferase involved in cell wall biosynthesis